MLVFLNNLFNCELIVCYFEVKIRAEKNNFLKKNSSSSTSWLSKPGKMK